MSDADLFAKFGVDLNNPAAASAPAEPAQAEVLPDADLFAKYGIDATSGAQIPAKNAKPIPPRVTFGGPQDASPAPALPSDAPTVSGPAAAVSGALNGIPVVGPYILGGAQRLSAWERSMDGGRSYADELRTVQAADAARQGQHPTATTVGNVGGALTGFGMLGMAAPEMMGLRGASMSGRMGAGALSNAAIGGADAKVRGDNPVVGAGLGAVGGAAAPLAGRAIGAVAGTLTDAAQRFVPTGVPGMSRSAANMLNSVIDADEPGAVQQTLAQHGPLTMLADAGPSLKGLTGGLVTKPSDAKSVITKALDARAAGSNDRVQSQIVNTIGQGQDPQALTDAIGAQRATEDQAYNAVHANAPPVDVSGVVSAIDDKLSTAFGPQKTALQNLRNGLVDQPASVDPATGTQIPETYQTNSELLHNARKVMDGVINFGNPGLGVEKGAVATNQGNLKYVRGALDNALKTQVPGMAEADAASSHLADQQNAVQEGTKAVFGKNVPFPDTFAATRAANDPEVNAAMNQGMAGAIAREFGTGTQRSTVGLNKLLAGGEGGFGAQNLSTAFGEGKTNALLDTLAREKLYDSTTNEVVRNSITSRAQAAAKLLDDTQPGGLNFMNASAFGTGLQAAKSLVVNPLVRMVMENPTAPRNLEMARALMAQGPERDELFDALRRLNGRQGSVSAVGGALQNASNASVNRLVQALSATQRPSFAN